MAILSETAIAVFGNRPRLHTKKINKKRLSPTYLPKNFLAHLWGAYAIPVALSVVRRSSYIVCRLCPP